MDDSVDYFEATLVADDWRHRVTLASTSEEREPGDEVLALSGRISYTFRGAPAEKAKFNLDIGRKRPDTDSSEKPRDAYIIGRLDSNGSLAFLAGFSGYLRSEAFDRALADCLLAVSKDGVRIEIQITGKQAKEDDNGGVRIFATDLTFELVHEASHGIKMQKSSGENTAPEKVSILPEKMGSG